MAFRTVAGVERGSAKINLHGAFDIYSGAQFLKFSEDLLDSPSVQELEIHMENVEFIDSAALGALLVLREKAAARHRDVVLTGYHDTVRDVLETANFPRLFHTR